jgi:beta-phosphoglucomutase-like phosphatase (HAD superfamily)
VLLGVAPTEIVAFEDTEAGVASAKAAGVRCVAVVGTHTRERLRAADELVDALDARVVRRVLG